MKLGLGGKLVAVLAGLGIIAFALDRYLGLERMAAAAGWRLTRPGVIKPGDFPPGSAAPAGEESSLPVRPVRIAAVARGAVAGLMFATGGTRSTRDSPVTKGYGLDVELWLEPDEVKVQEALATGTADLVALPLDVLARVRSALRDAAPRAVALLGRSRGADGIVAAEGIGRVEELGGHAIAVGVASPARFFVLWRLAQAGLHERSVRFLLVGSDADTAKAFKEGRVDVAAGPAAMLSLAGRERGGKVLATTADAPHLCATVLVARGEFASRYPEAVRRLVRAELEAADAVAKDASGAAQLLGAAAPALGDPRDAIALEPMARLAENLAFFGIAGDAPVRYDELYASAASVWGKLGETWDPFPPAESRETSALRAAARVADERRGAEGH